MKISLFCLTSVVGFLPTSWSVESSVRGSNIASVDDNASVRSLSDLPCPTEHYTFPRTNYPTNEIQSYNGGMIHGLCVLGATEASASDRSGSFVYNAIPDFSDGVEFFGNRGDYKAFGVNGKGDKVCEGGIFLQSPLKMGPRSGVDITVQATPKSGSNGITVCALLEKPFEINGKSYDRSGNWDDVLESQEGFFHYADDRFSFSEQDPDRLSAYCKVIYGSCKEPTASCKGYFCDKTLSTMFMFATHNSYATSLGHDDLWVYSPNQYRNVVSQFNSGIRGFNFDVYDQGGLFVDHTPDKTMSNRRYELKILVDLLMTEMKKPEYEEEIIVVFYEIKDGTSATSEPLVELWGDLVIKDFKASLPFSYYIEKGQRVLLLSSGSYNNAIGLYDQDNLVTQNWYVWQDLFADPNFSLGSEPKDEESKLTSAKMMNHFCTAAGLGSIPFSEAKNQPGTILYNARIFRRQPYAYNHLPNIILVDFMDVGNIWPAQDVIRSGNDSFGNEWSDGTLCGVATTCYNCYDQYSYWYSKAMTACGSEPCWSGGTLCGVGTTCNACCNGYHWSWTAFFTVCN